MSNRIKRIGTEPSQKRNNRAGRLRSSRLPSGLVKLYLYFGLSLTLLFVLLTNSYVSLKLMQPFTGFVAFFSSLILNVCGSETWVHGTSLLSSDYGIDVVYGCNGVFAIAILLSGIIAYPSNVKAKLIGASIGIPAIFLLNQLRVVSLFLLGESQPAIFNEVHVYVWQPIIIIFAIFVWDFWARHFVKKNKIRKSAVCR
jgi:exosortase H (IPTLxxWG-CTERM-specific)